MRGRSAKTYYDSAGNWETPTWVEIDRIIDETITPNTEVASGGARHEEFVDNEIASRNFEFSFTYRYDRDCGDEVYPALLAAFMTGDAMYMAFMDQAITTNGARGWKSPILLTQMPQTRNLGDLVEVSVEGVGKLVCENGDLRKPTPIVISDGEPTTTTSSGT